MIPKDPRREAGLRIVETARLLRLLVEHRLKPHGMTRAQFATLSKLERQEGLMQSELAEMLDVQPIAMVRIIDQLSGDQLIERRADPQDRRCNRLYLTAQGRGRLASLDGFKENLGRDVFAGIAEADISRLLETLTALHSNIKSIAAAAQEAPARTARARSA